jgi:VCBS repeat-containing protein
MHDQSLTVSSSVLSESTDVDGDPITATLVSGPNNGTLSFNSDGTFTYTPTSGFAGPDQFTYEATDGVESSEPAAVNLFVINNAPLAGSVFYSTPANQTLTVSNHGVLVNASDPDGDNISAQLVSGPAHGSLALNADGTFTYIPDSGFVGNDTFSFQAADGIASSSAAAVTITVTGAAPIANDDNYDDGMDQVLSVSAANGVEANDANPQGLQIATALVSGPADGSVTLNSDGSFTYTPDQGFTGPDAFSYELVANGQAVSNVAQANVVVASVQLAMQNSSWIPVNANDDNGAAWQANSGNMIPQVRDFNYLRQLPQNRTDPDLQPMTVTLNGVQNTGFVFFTISQNTATGSVRLWLDNRKSSQIIPFVFYPVNQIPATIYVEGISPSSRTIVGNGAQAAVQPVPNTGITITARYVNNWNPLTWVSGSVSVGVGPVVNWFTVNGGPTPPNPAGGPYAPQVGFGGGVGNITGGYTTGSVNLQTGVATPGAIFSAQVYNANVPGAPFNGNMPAGQQTGALQFIQNETITNGGPGQQNAWTFAQGTGLAPQNWSGALVNGPVLDMAGAARPAPPFYASTLTQSAVPTVQIAGFDNPSANIPTLAAIGLGTRNMMGQWAVPTVTAVAFTFNFTLYLTWQMPAGAGPLNAAPPAGATVIYTLATRTWTVVVLMNSGGVANGIANTIAQGSGVFSPNDFANNHADPIAIGPTANQAARIR